MTTIGANFPSVRQAVIASAASRRVVVATPKLPPPSPSVISRIVGARKTNASEALEGAFQTQQDIKNILAEARKRGLSDSEVSQLEQILRDPVGQKGRITLAKDLLNEFRPGTSAIRTFLQLESLGKTYPNRITLDFITAASLGVVYGRLTRSQAMEAADSLVGMFDATFSRFKALWNPLFFQTDQWNLLVLLARDNQKLTSPDMTVQNTGMSVIEKEFTHQ